MKVAIIGAGISGLSCAVELERHGIRPVIFEKRAHVGDTLLYSTIWPRIINRPLTDPIKYLEREYSLKLHPSNHIKRIVMYSSKSNSVERGSLGYIIRRGYQDNSLEYQLLDKVDSPINFNRYIELEDIRNDFEYIIVANAYNLIAKNLGIWTDTFNAQVRIATILGSFNPREIILWMNTLYSKNGFCYLIPNNEKAACLVMIVNGISSYELEYYWKRFLFTEDINYFISETVDVEHDCGFVQPVQTGNLLFVGNAAGFTDDLIGCGGLNAVESGMLAARAIIYGRDYNTLAAPIFSDIVKLHEIRKALNTMNNGNIDFVVSTLSLPFIKNAIYNNPFFRLSDMAGLVKRYNNYVKRKRRAVE